MRQAIALILGGGRGTRLYPLTSIRSKPAVPLACKYRLIDIPISNCINSGINRIYVLTQFMSVSLHKHLRQTYAFDQFSGGFVSLLAAQETLDPNRNWYQGTADAVRQNLEHLEQRGVKHVLILSGDQLYRMDYRKLIEAHQRKNADVTIAAMPVDRQAARAFGIMRVDESGRVVGFLEKPQSEDEFSLVRTDPAWIDRQGVASRGRDLLASLGIYVFNRQTLLDVLSKTNYKDFGKEVFPAAVRTRHVQMHLFDDYWEDIGTIRSFYEANLRLAGERPPLILSSPSAPIFSRPRFLPPTRIGHASIAESLIADGCTIGHQASIEGSLIGLRCIVGAGVAIRRSILMGSDFYDEPGEAASASPELGIGAGSVIEGAIVDKNARIGRNVVIRNALGIEEGRSADGQCILRDGIPVIVKNAVLPDGWRLSLA